ncbi:MAG: lipoyl synthase [Candidatus Tectomicrobia bacterium]|uniref:Lipoyl synthase n=1 Tax=Tectimicrobiota bacterium TaxID=2528274 RepID=A0A932GN44_UNCTE|nr:lipoyl synthase [Candidatus Tectomicrobia bacterium]
MTGCADSPVFPRKPPWLRVRVPSPEVLRRMKEDLGRLHTICEEARCPNLGECWSRGTATFLILNEICTRSCGFCAVKTGKPLPLDPTEPARVAESVRRMRLRFAVVTSVNRDDLPDGGARAFAETIRKIREVNPGCGVEVLIPDFRGSWEALRLVLEARPDVLGHNTETVPRLYRKARPSAKYERSLELLRQVKLFDPSQTSKSGIMLGLGETKEEVLAVMTDLHGVECDVLTVGQYLQPAREKLPVVRFVPPEEFNELKIAGEEMGFKRVVAGPLVRSSYHAEEHLQAAGAWTCS